MTVDAVHDARVVWPVAIPIAAAVAVLLGGRRVAAAVTYAAAAATAAVTATIVPDVLAGGVAELRLLSLAPGLALAFRVDGLGMTFGMLAAGLWVVTAVYSVAYARATQLRNEARFFAAFAASAGCAIGVAFSANLLTFLLFYELLTLTTYPLVAHKESPEALAAGRRYLLYALSGGLAVTVATAWTWAIAGTLEFTAGGFLAGAASGGELAALFALFLAGCGVKAAIMPMHAWLPAAMVAPTPVSALLHAVAVVKAGVFGSLRVIGFVFGPDALAGSAAPAVLAAMCAATIVIGSVLALAQDHLKRRLAYSTIVHLSYIVLGAALLTPLGMTGSIVHMVNHGLAKITLFFCAGSIYAVARVDKVSELRGLGRRMPWTFGAMTVASLGLIGVPGLCGFAGKLLLGGGAAAAEQWAYVAIMLGGSIFTAAYLLPIVKTAFFDGDRDAAPADAPPAMLVAVVAVAALVIVFGAVPLVMGGQHELAAGVADGVFGGAP